MNLVKKVWAALKPNRVWLKFRVANVQPCAYCGAEEPCAWLNMNRKYACTSAYLFCPVCGQDGPTSPSLEEAKRSWDVSQLAELSKLKKQAPACFEEVTA